MNCVAVNAPIEDREIIPDWFSEQCVKDWEQLEPLRDLDPTWPPFANWLTIMWARECRAHKRKLLKKVNRWNPTI